MNRLLLIYINGHKKAQKFKKNRPTRYKLPITRNFLVPPESHSAQEDRTSSRQMLVTRLWTLHRFAITTKKYASPVSPPPISHRFFAISPSFLSICILIILRKILMNGGLFSTEGQKPFTARTFRDI